MSYARLATIAIATALATLSLSTTLAFVGAINNQSTRGRSSAKNRLGRSSGSAMGSSLSSSSVRSEGGAAADENRNNGADPSDANKSDGEIFELDSQIMNPLSRRQSYAPPTTPVKPLAHYIFLVHGWLGNDLEMGYLSNAFRRIICPPECEENIIDIDEAIHESQDSSGSITQSAKRVRRSGSKGTQDLLAAEASEGGGGEASRPEIVVHSVKCNVGKTRDGIRNGGTRLANEIVDYVRGDVRKRLRDDEEDDADRQHHVTYSVVGNSLGGLYSRYAVSLLPYELPLHPQRGQRSSTINLHPNVFLTTATPHLGVSRHTYLPLPRVAEAVIGAGMGTTGRDLFRLNSEKDLASAAANNLVGGVVGGVRRLSMSNEKSGDGDSDCDGDASRNELRNDVDDDGLDCIIRSMCLEEKYLTPLRNFRKRIAYANAYGTDFQVPTETAAFLNERSGVGHYVIASRYASGVGAGVEGSADDGSPESEPPRDDEQPQAVRPFVVAVVRTDRTPRPQSHGDAGPSDELIRMSQSLDALGWTKVFIDVRDKIPVPRFAKPGWLRPACGSLDELIRERAGLDFRSLRRGSDEDDDSGRRSPNVEKTECILTSQEIAQSTRSGDSFDFPMGHTVMIANAKSEGYSKINASGRPVMDGLAEEMVEEVLEFE